MGNKIAPNPVVELFCDPETFMVELAVPKMSQTQGSQNSKTKKKPHEMQLLKKRCSNLSVTMDEEENWNHVVPRVPH